MSGLAGYATGGTVHLIVNNQLGFTTTPAQGRTSRRLFANARYASDVAKSIGAPIIHVNGHDPEATAFASELAVEYQQKFNKDIVIDLIGYRMHGHNELDEPSFTQPLMYKYVNQLRPRAVRAMESVGKFYARQTEIDYNQIRDSYFAVLDRALQQCETSTEKKISGLQSDWSKPFSPQQSEAQTSIAKEVLEKSVLQSVSLPSDFTAHSRLTKFHVDSRLKSLRDNKIDWATSEAIAFGSILHDGGAVRLAGQDVSRGTFSHRHAVFSDQNSGKNTCPLAEMGKFETVNSNLSEFAGLGFEYGYSLVDYKNLTLWEAQFGDFFNGAQIVVDTFVSSGEAKWLLQSGLVMLLPHGYDGAGPEHSSCRIERFLQMTNESVDGPAPRHLINMQVINPTTPAQYFHALRRQLKSSSRKPLIVASPKILLRLPAATSPISDFTDGAFRPVIADQSCDPSKVTKVVFVSGKLYYELEKAKTGDAALIRVEELSPFPWKEISAELEKFGQNGTAVSVKWCQEEPENMGAYLFAKPRMETIIRNLNKRDQLQIGEKVQYVGRTPHAAPATGFSGVYKKEHNDILAHCFQ